VVLALAGGLALLIVPDIREGKDRRAEEERRRDAAFEEAKRKELARESGTYFGRAERPPGKLSPAVERAARRGLVQAVEAAITRDARARARAGRLEGPILDTECRINPPSRRPRERDLSVRRMEYQCLAIKSRDPQGRFFVGHTFEATVDYERFRFRWSKVCYPPGEGSARQSC
jgi:hypothetical protein